MSSLWLRGLCTDDTNADDAARWTKHDWIRLFSWWTRWAKRQKNKLETTDWYNVYRVLHVWTCNVKRKSYLVTCSLFSSSVKGLISSVDSEKLEWPVLAAWACASISDFISFPQLNYVRDLNYIFFINFCHISYLC